LTIGRRLKEERERLGLSQPAFADLAGASKGSQIAWEKGVASPNAVALASFAKAGVDLLYVVTGERVKTTPATGAVAPSFVMVPRYDLAASAGPGYHVSSEQVVDYLAFKADWIRNALGVAQKNLALISVKGDSMQPTLTDGDLVLVDISRKMIEDSGIYVIHLSDTLMVKRVQRHLDGSLTVTSDTSKYSPERVTASDGKLFHVVGRVVWTGRRL